MVFPDYTTTFLDTKIFSDIIALMPHLTSGNLTLEEGGGSMLGTVGKLKMNNRRSEQNEILKAMS